MVYDNKYGYEFGPNIRHIINFYYFIFNYYINITLFLLFIKFVINYNYIYITLKLIYEKLT